MSVRGQDDRSYKELVLRCEELKLESCKGTKKQLLQRVLEEERRQEIIERSNAFPIPVEIFRYEVIKHLGFLDLLSYCHTDSSAEAFCAQNDVLGKKVVKLNYSELKEAVLLWAWNGVLISGLLDVLPELVDRLDMHTYQIVSYYLLEQERTSEAKEVKTIYIANTVDNRPWDDLFTWPAVKLDQIIRLIETYNYLTNPMEKSNFLVKIRFLFGSMVAKAMDSETEAYLARLVVNTLSDKAIHIILKSITTNFSYSIRAWKNPVSDPFYAYLYRYLKELGRLSSKDAALLKGSIWNDVSPHDIFYAFTKDEITAKLMKGELPTLVVEFFTPQELVDAFPLDPKLLNELLEQFFEKYDGQYPRRRVYNVWYMEVLREMKRAGIDLSTKYGSRYGVNKL